MSQSKFHHKIVQIVSRLNSEEYSIGINKSLLARIFVFYTTSVQFQELATVEDESYHVRSLFEHLMDMFDEAEREFVVE